MNRPAFLREVSALATAESERLDRAFFALSDPVRRAILARLAEGDANVGELAEPFDISLQAVSRHIQVLVQAGLVSQTRTGRINRCGLLAGPAYEAAVWLNRYAKYWQRQFDTLAAALAPAEPGSKSKSKSRGKSP